MRGIIACALVLSLALACAHGASRAGAHLSPKNADPDSSIENDATEGLGRPYEKKDLSRNRGDDRDYERYEADLMHDETEERAHLPEDEVAGAHNDESNSGGDPLLDDGESHTGQRSKLVAVHLNNQNKLDNPLGWAAQFAKVPEPQMMPLGLSDEPAQELNTPLADRSSKDASDAREEIAVKNSASSSSSSSNNNNNNKQEEESNQQGGSSNSLVGATLKGMCVLSARQCPSGFKSEGVAALRIGEEFMQSNPFPVVPAARSQIEAINKQLREDEQHYRFVAPLICCATTDQAELGDNTYLLGKVCPEGTSEVLSGVVWDKAEYDNNPFNEKEMDIENFDDKHVWVHPYVCKVTSAETFLSSKSRVCMMAGQCSDATRTFGHAGVLVDKKTVQERSDVQYVFKVAHARRLPPVGDFVWVRPKMCCSSRKRWKKAQQQGSSSSSGGGNANANGNTNGGDSNDSNGGDAEQQKQTQKKDQDSEQPAQEGEAGGAAQQGNADNNGNGNGNDAGDNNANNGNDNNNGGGEEEQAQAKKKKQKNKRNKKRKNRRQQEEGNANDQQQGADQQQQGGDQQQQGGDQQQQQGGDQQQQQGGDQQQAGDQQQQQGGDQQAQGGDQQQTQGGDQQQAQGGDQQQQGGDQQGANDQQQPAAGGEGAGGNANEQANQ